MSHRWPERPGGKPYTEPKKKVAPKAKFDTAPLPTPSKGPKLSTGWRSTAALEQEVATLRLRLHERVTVEQQLYAKLRSAELRLAALGGNNSLTNPDLADPESRMNALIARAAELESKLEASEESRRLLEEELTDTRTQEMHSAALDASGRTVAARSSRRLRVRAARAGWQSLSHQLQRRQLQKRAPMELLHRTLGRARFAKSLGAMAAPAAAVNAAEVWRLQSWLESLPLTEIVGDALQQLVNELAEVTPHLGDSTPQREFALVRAVGATCDSTLVRTLLDEGGLLQRLADELVSGAGALERGVGGGGGGELGGGGGGEVDGAHSAAPPPMLAKFCADAVNEGDFELVYGDTDDYHRGLERLVGKPNADRLAGMRSDHLDGADARHPMTAHNYGTTTCSAVEWAFVTDPVGSLKTLELERWPVDTKLAANVELHARCRRPKPVAEFADARADLAARLVQKGVTPLTDAEFVGCRLYTGPLFVKYNGVLRGAHGRVPAFVATMEEMCRGNLYATTLHTIADGMRRLSLLTPCDQVYRGMSGGRLPPSFSAPDPSGAVGGVEFGFMSTTRNKEVAFEYAQRCGIVFEIEQGMVDRGADLSWLSQYPHEREVCFGPCTALECTGTTVSDATIVVKLRPAVGGRQGRRAVDGAAAPAPPPKPAEPKTVVVYENADEWRGFALAEALHIVNQNARNLDAIGRRLGM